MKLILNGNLGKNIDPWKLMILNILLKSRIISHWSFVLTEFEVTPTGGEVTNPAPPVELSATTVDWPTSCRLSVVVGYGRICRSSLSSYWCLRASRYALQPRILLLLNIRIAQRSDYKVYYHSQVLISTLFTQTGLLFKYPPPCHF
jgi:hypothetical protein